MTKNITLIDKSKQTIVTDLCELAGNSAIVKRMIIFGSAASNSCTVDSDVDICFDLSCDTRNRAVFRLNKEASRICDYNCDIFFYNLIGDKLKNEIDQKGIVVYEP